MHAHAAADRHVADDRVARHGRTALRKPHQHVVDAGDAHAARFARGLAHRRLANLRKIDDVVALDFVADAVDHRLRGGIAEADRREQIGRRGIVHAMRDALDQLAARKVGPQPLARKLRFDAPLARRARSPRAVPYGTTA